MSYFYSLRGWLEVDPEDMQKVTERIIVLRTDYDEDQRLKLYMQGWCWNESVINWTSYIFYGADVTIDGLRLLEEVLKNIARMELHISGHFHAQGEDGEKNMVYKIVDDVWWVENASILIDLT